MDEIKAGSRWTNGDNKTLRVMAVAEGYVMYRFKGCGVNVIYWKDFLKKYTAVKAEEGARTPSKQRGFIIEALGNLLFLAGVVALLMGAVWLMGDYSCKAKWSESGLQFKYGPIAGCRVSEDGKTWIPDERWRHVE